MEGWEEPINGETEANRRERLAKAAAHDDPPFDQMDEMDRYFIRDALRSLRKKNVSGPSVEIKIRFFNPTA